MHRTINKKQAAVAAACLAAAAVTKYAYDPKTNRMRPALPGEVVEFWLDNN